MFKRLLVVAIVGAIGFAGVQASAFAKAPADRQQSQQGTEQELLRRLEMQPRDLTAQLDLIRIYLDTNRLAEAEGLLARALNQVREQRIVAQQAAMPPAVAPAQPIGSGAVRVGGDVQEPKLIRRVPPVYPQIAQAAKVTGVVIVELLVDVDGTVRNARILRSLPLLDQAALDAVRQWQFTPTLLNGVPVQVIMTVTVNFTLPG
jgi:TonB family protein